MTLTIELTPNEEARLAAAAQSELIAPEALVKKFISTLPLLPAEADIEANSRVADAEDLLTKYHLLLDRKFTVGLSDSEAAQLAMLRQCRENRSAENWRLNDPQVGAPLRSAPCAPAGTPETQKASFWSRRRPTSGIS